MPETDTLFSQVPASHSNVWFQRDLQFDPQDITGLGAGGKGIAIGDINGDGLADLFFTGGAEKSKLYLNKGDFVFEDITERAGIFDKKDRGETTSATMADVNGDGLLDIYLLKAGLEGNVDGSRFSDFGANLLFINNGDLTFTERSAQYNLNVIGPSRAATFFDYDNDGDLDVYILNLPDPGRSFNFEYYRKPPKLEWYSDKLFENQDNYFVDVTESAGILFERNIGQSVSVADVNRDGWLDVFVANDFFGRNFLYINNGDKTFTERSREFFKVSSMSAMGSDFADINNDGYLDLFVGEMMPEGNYRQKLNLVPFSLEVYNNMEREAMQQYTRNTLYLNNEGSDYAEIGLFAGVEATEWSWGSVFGDFDNDGFQDLFVANGIKRDMTNMDFIRSQYGEDISSSADPEKPMGVSATTQIPSVRTHNYMFRNEGSLKFADMSETWGFAQPVHTRGAAYADLDNDGDLDLVINNVDTIPFIYRNNSQEGSGHYLRLKLEGNNSNSHGLGTTVVVYQQGKMQVQQLTNTRGFSSTCEPIIHFGFSSAATIDSVQVNWLGGGVQQLYNIEPNQLLTVKQTNGLPAQLAMKLHSATMFEDVTNQLGIGFKHQESAINDFKNHRLLHRVLTTEGPSIAVGDVNGDGLDDFFIGGAKGQSGVLYFQKRDGSFAPAGSQPWQAAAGSENTGALFFDADGDNDLDLYLASGSSEFEDGSPDLMDKLYLNNGKGSFTLSRDGLPTMLSSSSCVIAGDYDNDGDLDLFIGGRYQQGSYPYPGKSYLLQNNNGVFKDVTNQVPGLSQVGMVTAAVWTDFDNDNDLDLILVGEWMPVTLFENHLSEGFKKLENIKGLENSNGWWNDIVAADFDQDGNVDYVLGNLGENSIFKASRDAAVALEAADFDGNGTIDPVVFRTMDGVAVPFANRDLFCSQMPVFNNLYYNFERYAKASKQTVFGDTQPDSVYSLKATELRSCYLRNDGNNSFTLKPLPYQAQLSPVNCIGHLDVNKDGHLDIILAGNSRTNHFEYGPTFGFKGLILLGDGKGNFTALPPGKSGLALPGEARAITQLKGADGNVLLLIANNNDSIQAFKLLPR